MLDVILDLYRHMEWADAEQWRALLAHGPAREDAELRERLVHLHGAQSVWLGRFQGMSSPPHWPSVADYPRIEDLRHYAGACHAALRAWLPTVEAGALEQVLTFRALAGDEVSLALGDGLMQVPLHSHYHRGQNATRMRALGSAMPTTDWALWARKGRPTAQWPEVAK